jgi:hypothetical protein
MRDEIKFSTSNILPNVRDEIKFSISIILPNVRDEILKFSTSTVLPSVQDEKKNSTYNVLPGVRDETSNLQHCVFRSRGIRNRTYLHNTVPTVPVNYASFGQIGLYLAFFGLILRLQYVLLFCTHLREPSLSLLVSQLCDICTAVMNIAYVFDSDRQHKSLLRTIWNVVVHDSVAAPSPTMDPLACPSPQHLHVGGGACKGIVWSSIEKFVYSSLPYSINTRGKVLYTAYVDHKGLQMFSAEKYVYAKLPLANLVDLVTLRDARSMAALHSIVPGSRCNATMLKSCVAKHSCSECPEYVTVFSIEKDAATKHIERTVRHRAKVTADQTQKPEVNARFPPEPASREFELSVIRNACKRMDPKDFEEVGCAVCGELKPRSDSSSLKSIKNILGILEAPGVTRVERKTDKCPIKEYRGPVLDYSCSSVCSGCRGDLRKGKVPKLALSNNLWLGTVPNVLKNLTFVEKMLVAEVRHTCAFVKVASGMRKMKANIVAFESPIQKIYNILPPPREDLDEVLAILFTGPCKPTAEDFARTPFLVRRDMVIAALEWLRLNHSDYADIQISQENVKQYEENMPPVSVEYRERVSNKVAEGTSVFDQEEEEGTVEGDCAFTVHGLTGENLSTMTPTALKAIALRHLNSGGKMLAVGHSDKFQSMWNNPQLYPQMFPWLFPYGLGGIGGASTRISSKEQKRHLLMYHDKRFQVDVNFPFVAFSHEQVKSSTTQGFIR